eukprot:CAMPEP_0181077186 /NCGR_PEP_ID=MMETSP1071-20121207/816_1 /TAXON_ID=35127 /ORGANISM="Thalassiosira sp., Strain NH16" /LENGTH=309 /DNA_ID=CAMNT_0023158413 /DNA_START=466 /DNA_END=1395 /DNA_ORIENTATION=+
MKVPNHSLGWISLSIKPPVALAMASMSLNVKSGCRKSRLAINLMSGEGTVELEASRAVDHSLFLITGDKSYTNALKTARRVKSLHSRSCHGPLVDIVVWDAQNLPLRRGIADAIFADLPIQGSLKKIHQEPKTRKVHTIESPATSSLSYSQVLGEASMVLKAKGRTALLSPDFKALRHASSGFNWRQLGYSTNINLGGLTAKLFLMERKEACTKDLSMWVPTPRHDLSSWIFAVAKEACKNLKVQQLQRASLVSMVQLHSTFFHEEKNSFSHCYRVVFDDMVQNVDTRKMERLIREEIEIKAPVGIALR